MYGFNSMGGIIPFLAMSKRWQFCQEDCLKTHSLKTGMDELNQFDSYFKNIFMYLIQISLLQVKHLAKLQKKGQVIMEQKQFLCREKIGW